MKDRISICAIVFLLLSAVPGFSQMEQLKKSREKMDTSLRASEERLKAEKEAANQPKAAVMNVDVQMVLAAAEFKSFAEAKAKSISKVVDGDPLWLYIRFNGPLGQYVRKLQQDGSQERYILFAEIAPKGDVTAKSHYLIEFDKDDLKLTELKISLAPGRAGHNKSLPLFIKTAAGGKPGLWSNEIRLANVETFPRGLTDNLATAAITLDLSAGVQKYRQVYHDFDSMVLRNSLDESILPIAGKFDDPSVRDELMSKLKAEGITPASLFFADDFWLEYSDQLLIPREERSVWAAFTYQTGKDCRYGTAKVSQKFDSMNNRYGESAIVVKKDIATPCKPAK